MTAEEAIARQAAFDCRDTQCRELVRELVEALEEMCDDYPVRSVLGSQIHQKARAALARAKGATQ